MTWRCSFSTGCPGGSICDRVAPSIIRLRRLGRWTAASIAAGSRPCWTSRSRLGSNRWSDTWGSYY